MRHADITLRITRLSMLELRSLGGNVLANFRGNAHFPEPPTPLPVLEALLQRFSGLISEATHGSRQALLQRNDCAAELRTVLNAMASYARGCAVRNAAVLATSGFPLRKIPEPIGPLPAPAGFQASMGPTPGSIRVRWKKVRGARMYQLYLAPKGSDDWQRGPTVARISHTIQGLRSDARYCVKVVALGTAGMSPESGVAQAMAA